MAQIDHSIYFQQQAPDFLGNIQKGLSVRDMMDQRQRQKALDLKQKSIEDAYAQGMTTNPDGTVSVDSGKTVSALAKVGAGKEAMDFQEKALAQNAAQEKQKIEKRNQFVNAFANLGPKITDQSSYTSVRNQLAQMGFDVSGSPESYDPGYVNNILGMALTVKDRFDNEFREKELLSKSLDRKEARDERRFQAGIKMDEKMQGLKTPYGLANTEDDAKQLKGAFESKEAFDNKLQQMIDLRTKHNGGALWNREDVARGKQLSKDLLLEYKNLQKLGVLSKSDEDIINAIIPDDPLEYASPVAAVQGQDPIKANMQKFMADSDKDFQTRVQTRTRQGMAGYDGGFEKDVLDYAQKHGISPEAAKQIKQQRTSPKSAGR